ncbi:DNA mismatch repair endonuclease MutL [uncultured Paraglaciecola sp.]|uniref:DNA mismatch repair endonuclease MutL n=1 Tax=uncultured Paraglaciecola sp. TaxID=1765024 RepID=UPI00260F4F0B|nr:DNA mismatch repair endonuclease MutL [uncultured Paraglaciecola sp.]
MPIQILPARLANQIAAGEVVERPASVVKELVENSLDSGATSIDIEIEKGGHKKILIRDNGSGIPQDELPLALSRHATSKIAKLDDLEAINSLGFRGEALASISSVARLTLSSKPKEQSQAWQAHCEGRDMQVQLNPVAHPDGSSVDVVDLFFNTPARRKFLKTEKTEFSHIDEVVRRIALSRFDVSFSLKHNGKLLRRYPAVKLQNTELKRISAICGNAFSEHCIELNSQYQQLELKGWLAQPDQMASHGGFQYFYVNGRMMRDKLINHAVRQAFEGLVGDEVSLSYVLYLSIEPSQIDVNVHPAKHEVRFHQARLVHDFIYRALTDSLNQFFKQGQQSSTPEAKVLPQAIPKHDYIQPLQRASAATMVHEQLPRHSGFGTQHPSASRNLTSKDKAQHLVNSSEVINQASVNYQQLMTPAQLGKPKVAEQSHAAIGQWLQINDNQLLVSIAQQFYLLETQALYLAVLSQLYSDTKPVSQPLLMPISISATPELLAKAKSLYQPLIENSVEIGWTPNRIILRKVPAGLRQLRWAECLEHVLQCKATDSKEVCEHLLSCIASNQEISVNQIQELWQQFVHISKDLEHAMSRIGKVVPLQELLSTHENR